MPPANNPNYDFILNNEPPKKRFMSGSGSTTKQRILFAVAGGLIMLLLGFVIFSFLLGGEAGQTDKLIDIAARQQEVIRLSDAATEQAKGSDTLQLATTTKLSMLSLQKETLDLVKKQGEKVKETQINSYKSRATDEKLSAAQQSNRYDEAFLEVLNTALADYQKAVKSTFDTSTSQNERLLLDKAYRQVGLLLAKNN